MDSKPINETTNKDSFPLSFNDQVLDSIAGCEQYRLCNDFQKISLEDQRKTTFTKPWGCFCFRVFPYGFSNGATFF